MLVAASSHYSSQEGQGHGGSERGNSNNKGNNSNDEKPFEKSNISGVPGALMAVFFGISSASPFESPCQKDAADKVKLFVDKRKLVLSNSFSNTSQQQKLEKYGNSYNGKLYDENNIRTMKVDPKKLQCEVRDSSSERENFEIVSDPSSVMTCGANVIENVKKAVASNNVYGSEHKQEAETFKSPLEKKIGNENALQAHVNSDR